MTIRITSRKGWYYALLPRPHGAGRAVRYALRTKSFEEAQAKIRESKLETIALASHADALTREVWTRLLAGRNVAVCDAIKAYQEHRFVVGGAAETVADQGAVLDQLARFAQIGTASISMVDAKHISEFVNRPGPQTLATRAWWLSIVKGWLAYCVEQRWIIKNSALDVAIRIDGLTQRQLVSKPYEAFTEGEVLALLAAVPRSDFWHGAVLLAFHYGLRLGSIATMEEGNIVTNRIRIFTTKGRKVVNEYMNDELIAWLEEWKTHRESSEMSFIFPAQAALYLSSPSSLSIQFSRLLAKHGIATTKCFHGIRKTSAQKRWSVELDELGDEDKRRLMACIAKRGFKRVQQMLAHADGSSVTADHYM
jgi:integrase